MNRFVCVCTFFTAHEAMEQIHFYLYYNHYRARYVCIDIDIDMNKFVSVYLLHGLLGDAA